MYDQEANAKTSQETSVGNKRKADAVGYAHGKQHPVHLRIGNGNQLYAWFVGKGSGQRRDLQDDFTRVFYSHRRHDWVPIWYQTHAK